MKNKFLLGMLSVAMAAVVLTGCGDDKETNTPATQAPVQTQAQTTAAPASATAGTMVSDATFSVLQDNYAVMVEGYNAVKDLYSADEIAANAEIESLMNEIADIINEMGEVSQDNITEEDAVALNNAMGDILDSLALIVDGMELTPQATPVSDETFAVLQENYQIMVSYYNVIAEVYSSDQIAANKDIEEAMNTAADVINEMGEISQDSLTEADAVALNDVMVQIMEVLEAVVLEMDAK